MRKLSCGWSTFIALVVVGAGAGACGGKDTSPARKAAATSEKAKQEAAEETAAPGAEVTRVEPAAVEPATAEPLEPAEQPLALSAGKPFQETFPTELGKQAAGTGIARGTKVPEFAAKTHLGKPITSTQLIARGPLLVLFYRGGWCPYCNTQVKKMADAAKHFAARGITPVMVSVDELDGAAMAQATYKIPFPVISDPDLSLVEAFNVANQLTTAGYSRLQGFGLDIERWSDREHHILPHPSAFLVDKTGTVVWGHVATDYKVRPSVTQLLNVVLDWQESLNSKE